MLTYDAVLRTQDRILNPNDYPIEESVYFNNILHEDIVLPPLVIPEPIKKLAAAMKNLLDKLVALVGKAFSSFGNFLRAMVSESRGVIGDVAKVTDKVVVITGMKVQGYRFSGLNNQVTASYKRLSLDDFLKQLNCPKIDTWQDVQKYREQVSNSNKIDFTVLPENEQFAKLVKVTIGMNLEVNGSVDNMYNDMMLQLWGSRDPMVLEAEKDFTFGGELKKLASPPLARSILMNYKKLQKKLDGTRKLLPFLTKPGTAVDTATKVQGKIERNLSKSDKYSQSFGLSREDTEKMKADLRWEASFMRYYVQTLKALSSNMNRLNKGLITTVKAQNQQSKFIIRKALTYKTVGSRVAKDTKRSEKAFKEDEMNAYTSTHRNENEENDNNKERG